MTKNLDDFDYPHGNNVPESLHNIENNNTDCIYNEWEEISHAFAFPGWILCFKELNKDK